MTRWRWIGGCAAAVAAVGLVANGPATAQDSSLSDAIAALVPDDADDLDTDEVDTFLGDMLSFLDGSAPTTGGSSKLIGPCGGFAFSFDEDGNLIDAAYDLGDDAPPQDMLSGGQAFTSGNPFTVDTGGKVTYVGFAPQSGAGPENHTYNLKVAGVEVDSGGDPNPNGKNRNAGTIDIGDEMPIDVSFAFTASGRMDAPEFTSCVGEGHVEFDGAGLTGPVGLVGLGLTAVGLAGLFVARPARTWRLG